MERRLTAILAADVAGYSRLMGVSEVATLAALKAHRAELIDGKIAEHLGRIVKLTGDGMLVEFPSVVNAVACAAGIQREMRARNAGIAPDRRIEFRIGINLGDVIAEDGDIFGDGVNIAARIEAIAQPGGVAVSGSVRDHVGNKLELTFEDMGEQTLKNIEQPVRVYNVRLDAAPLYLSALAGIGQTGSANSTAAATSNKVSIAVLPFTNMSGDAEQDFFADGLAEDLLTELARNRHLSVVSRNSSFVYKGKAVNAQAAGRELGADFILEGSVRKSEARVRIAAQLIDCTTGNHVWVERYDRSIDDIFELQDEIVNCILVGLTFNLDEAAAMQRQRAATPSAGAYLAFLRGRAAWNAGDAIAAREQLRRTIELDPNYARALAFLAFLYADSRLLCDSGMSDSELVQCVSNLTERALRIDHSDPLVLNWVAFGLFAADKGETALRYIETASAMNPRHISIMLHRSLILSYLGRHGEGLDLIAKSIAAEPRLSTGFRGALSEINYLAGNYQAAIDVLEQIIDIPPDLMLVKTAALAQLGHFEEAKQIVQRAKAESKPNFDPVFVGRVLASRCKERADSNNWLDGFRKAGIEV